MRTLRTVFFTDIVGSTEKAAALGDAGWSALLRQYHEVVVREVHRGAGEIVGSTGDGTVAIFEGPTAAILAALAIRAALRQNDIEVRAGIHMGEVVRSGSAIEGIGVHIGARVADKAGPGEVLVSSTVHDAEVGSDFGFEDRGIHTLKGVPGQWRLYAVARGPAGALEETESSPWRSSSRRATVAGAGLLITLALLGYLVFGDRGEVVPDLAAGSAEPGIAILPFTVNDPELERWQEGMVDLLSTNLDGVAGIRAIDSRTVISRWRRDIPQGETADLAAALRVARATGARYGLIGSVVSSGSDIRLVAEIYELADVERSLGEEQVQGSPDSIFGLIDRLSIALLDRILEAEATTPPTVDLSDITTTSVPALRAFLEGEALLRRSQFSESTAAYERAAAADTLFALAWFRLMESAGWIENIGINPAFGGDAQQRAWALRHRLPQRERRLLETTLAGREGRPEATDLARDTADTYPDDPRAWYLLGEALFHQSHQSSPGRAEREAPFERAVELDPLFTPAFVHLLDIAFQYADSSRVLRLLSEYERGASGSAFDRQYRLAFGLAWGDPTARSSSSAALDTVPSSDVARVVYLFDHPRFFDIQDQLVEILAQRPDVSRSFANEMALRNKFQQGRLREAINIAVESGTDVNVRQLFFWTLYQYQRGGLLEATLVEDAVFAREFTLPIPENSASPGQLFRAAAYAVDRRREGDYERTARLLESWVEKANGGGDTLGALQGAATLVALQGYAATSHERSREGIPLLDEAYRSSGSPAVRSPLLLSLVRAGRTDEVSALVGEAAPEPYAGSLAGPLFDQIGRRDEARDAWEWVVLAWDEADPELQPRLVEAQRGIARLRGNQGN